MRILMISYNPWRRSIGGSRVVLCEQLEQLGHAVTRFAWDDAFPHGRRSVDRRPLAFSARAAKYVRAHAGEFDVVDALQGALPYSKRSLRFEGVLAARSVGLFAFYRDYKDFESRTWPELIPGTRLSQAVARRIQRREFDACRRSYEVADLALLENEDEVRYARDVLELAGESVALPPGLDSVDAAALASARAPAATRLRAAMVVFIGTWSLRKGQADWPEIVTRLKGLRPDVRFRLLGTGVPSERVHRELGFGADDGVEVRPSFTREELPQLLAEATVGIFPSYAEGWGLGVLEQLAAGVPTIAYDVPGPRTMLGPLDLLVPRGDVKAMSGRAAELLELDADSYTRLSEQCLECSQPFRWDRLAVETARAYSTVLERVSGAR